MCALDRLQAEHLQHVALDLRQQQQSQAGQSRGSPAAAMRLATATLLAAVIGTTRNVSGVPCSVAGTGACSSNGLG